MLSSLRCQAESWGSPGSEGRATLGTRLSRCVLAHGAKQGALSLENHPEEAGRKRPAGILSAGPAPFPRKAGPNGAGEAIIPAPGRLSLRLGSVPLARLWLPSASAARRWDMGKARLGRRRRRRPRLRRPEAVRSEGRRSAASGLSAGPGFGGGRRGGALRGWRGGRGRKGRRRRRVCPPPSPPPPRMTLMSHGGRIHTLRN